jgi:hypothetical protein
MKYTALNPIEKKYPYCDSNGNLLKSVSGKFEKGYFLNEATQEKHDTAFFLVNNKPLAKIGRTKETDNYREVSLNEVDDLIIEKQYIVESNKLYEDLINSGKALKLGMSFGGGGRYGSIKVYYAYIYPSTLYKGLLFMSVGTTRKSEVLLSIVEELETKHKLEGLNIAIQGVDKAKVEDLIQI